MDEQHMSRREFIATSGAVAGVAATIAAAGSALGQAKAAKSSGSIPPIDGKSVAIIEDPSDQLLKAAPVRWALAEIRDALKARDIAVRNFEKVSDSRPGEFCIVAASGKSQWLKQVLEESRMSLPNVPEAIGLASAGIADRSAVVACGNDARGLMYALLDVADRISRTDPPLAALRTIRPTVEAPSNRIRSVARLFASDVEDKGWFRDKAFWREYLTMLARERFNRFNLTLGLGYDFARQVRDAYFYFAYPFLLAVPNYNVRVIGLSEKERDENLELLKFMSDEAVQRGLDFQLGIWTHTYRWTDSPQVNYTIDGLDDEHHASYSRDALTAVLKACPSIGGVTIRTHGESGVAEGNYDFWKTVFQGAAGADRKVEIDLHAKGIDQTMIDGALATGMPVNVSPKFWAEHTGLPYHQAAIRALEMPPRDGRNSTGLMALSNGSRRFMRYSYGDLFRNDRKYGILFRMWPGTQRLLLSGDPASARGWGQTASFCGSLGMEICEPLSFKGRKGSGLEGGRTAYQDKSLAPEADWKKYEYTYRLWGRMLFNPETEPENWQRMLAQRWGAPAMKFEQALSHASRILPLVTSAHLPSAANANYWPELYTNMSISDASVPHPYGDSPSPKRFGTVSPLDPALFLTCDQCADELLSGKSSGKYSPVEVAAWIDELAAVAASSLTDAQKIGAIDKNVELRRAAVDIAIQSAVGRFFANKFKAAVLFAIYDRTGNPRALDEAVKQYRAARNAWADAASRADGVYVRDITFGPEKHLRGCWSERLAAIDADVARLAKAAEASKQSAKSADVDPKHVDEAIEIVLRPPAREKLACEHRPAKSFRAGDSLPISLTIAKDTKSLAPKAVVVHFRHVNQAESEHTAEMQANGDRWAAEIPSEYTQSPYPLQYYFEVRGGDSKTTLHPGFDSTLCNQPYFVVEQA